MTFPQASRPTIELNAAVKASIRQLLATDHDIDSIARMYNCSENQVRGIKSQMNRTRPAKRTTAPVKRAATRKPEPVSELARQTNQAIFRRTNTLKVVRIDASNFDEVILVNGDNEVRVQISS